MSTPATVVLGHGYQGLDAWKVENPSDQRFIPGRTIQVFPAHEECGSWRAILAGVDANGDAIVVPLTGHDGPMQVRRLNGSTDLGLAVDGPFAGSRYAEADQQDWTAAKVLALSTAYAFGLAGIGR